MPIDIVTKYDAPMLGSAVKQWLLESDPLITAWEGWEDLRRYIPTVSGVTGKG